MQNRALKIFPYNFEEENVLIPYKHLIIAGMLDDYSLLTNIPVGTDIEKFLQSTISSPAMRAIPQVVTNFGNFMNNVVTDGYLTITEVSANLTIFLNTENVNNWVLTISATNSKNVGIVYSVHNWNYEDNPNGQFITPKGEIRVNVNHNALTTNSKYGTNYNFEYRIYGMMDIRNKDSQVKYLNTELFPYVDLSEFTPAGIRVVENEQILKFSKVLALCDLSAR